VRLREAKDAPVLLRKGTSDVAVLWDTFYGRYHQPPSSVLPSSTKMIWDIGSNIGLTIFDLARNFPDSVVIGLEPDPGNAALCRRNVSRFGRRCSILEAAAWVEDGEVRFHSAEGMEFAGAITETPASAGFAVRAISLNTLLKESETTHVDYVKLDVEGAEQRLLTENNAWAASVHAINVEIHDPYTPGECVRDLETLGFTSEIDERHWASVIGIRS
jgi:FkbM family methyltransferase